MADITDDALGRSLYYYNGESWVEWDRSVTGTFWQTTQPVSGTFWQTTQPVSGPLTDTQLRLSDVKVSLDSEINTFKVDQTTPGTTNAVSAKLIDESGSPYGIRQINNKPMVSSMPYTYDIARGYVTDHRSWSKIGFVAGVNATERDVAPWMTAPYVYPTGELTMTIVGGAKDCQRAITAFADSGTSPGSKTKCSCVGHGLANADTVIIEDNATYAGTYAISNVAADQFDITKVYSVPGTATVRGPGANTITVYYLDDGFEEKSTTVTMLGATPVNIATDMYRVQNARIATAGTSLCAVGAITIANGGITYGYISATKTRMRQCLWTVPLGKTLYVTQIAFSSAKQAAAAYARFTTRANFDNLSGTILQRGLFMPFNEVLTANTAYFRELNPPTKLPATVDLKVSVASSGTDTVDCTCALRGWLE
jgi:hypothetical protein